VGKNCEKSCGGFQIQSIHGKTLFTGKRWDALVAGVSGDGRGKTFFSFYIVRAPKNLGLGKC